jgi:hypothetical protein
VSDYDYDDLYDYDADWRREQEERAIDEALRERELEDEDRARREREGS